MLTPLYRGPAEPRWRTGSKVKNGRGDTTQKEKDDQRGTPTQIMTILFEK